MNRLTGSLAVTSGAIALGLIAGFAGARAGLSQAHEPEPFPQTVSHLLDDGSVGLTQTQRERIAALRQVYEGERKASGARLQTALVALSEAVVQNPGKNAQVEAAAALVDGIVHERRMASIAFIADARGLLAESQRAAFDKAFLSVVAHDPSYSQ
jgi:Spy/CpxP family protein refolding chaperone